MVVNELIGVYDADGTPWGELTYWIGARLGRRHCSLCDVTHGSFTEKTEWRECRAALSVPFTTYHRDDQPDDVRSCIGGRLPAVVARTADGVTMFVTPDELDGCNGSPQALRALIAARLAIDEGI